MDKHKKTLWNASFEESKGMVMAIVAQRLYDQSIVQDKMTSREETLKVDEVYLYHD
ncbi:TPA: hypothetical protein ACGO11_001303 [Streptococcus suis]